MISRQQAEQASRTLGLSLEEVSEPTVRGAFRELAKAAHPDAGGDAAKFVELDRARCVLQLWLDRPQLPASEAVISSSKCAACGGSGRRTLQRGFKTMTMVCGVCRGQGELVPPDKVEP